MLLDNGRIQDLPEGRGGGTFFFEFGRVACRQAKVVRGHASLRNFLNGAIWVVLGHILI